MDGLDDRDLKTISRIVEDAIENGQFDSTISEQIRDDETGEFDDAIMDHIKNGFLNEEIEKLIKCGDFDDVVKDRATVAWGMVEPE